MIGRVGPVARALGFAGLLPQVAAVVIVTLGKSPGHDQLAGATPAALFAGGAYALIILSFLGGMWWGLAMRRERGQGAMAFIAVVPSLVALALVAFASAWAVPAGDEQGRWTLIAIGSSIILTLPVDYMLARQGDTPQGWMRLRVPLSVGLGGLTVLLGLLIDIRVVEY